MTKATLLTILGSALVLSAVGYAIYDSVALSSNTTSQIIQDTSSTPQSSPSLEAQDVSTTVETDTLFTITATESGKTAFELLQSQAQVEFTEYPFGVFIESINGLAGDASNFWALYVNDEYSQTGADQTVLESGDVVEFRYEAVK